MAKKDLELFRTRRTVRKFTAEGISDETLTELLDAATLAPTRLDRRPLHYLVIRSDTIKTKLAEALQVRPYIEGAPVVIAVCADPVISPTWELDGSAAIENMLLAATALGLGGTWVGPRRSQRWEQAVEVLRQVVGFPDNLRVVSLVSIGHPEGESRSYDPGEKLDPTRIHYDHWDNLKL